jgi:GT2 family glycosyltransferase
MTIGSKLQTGIGTSENHVPISLCALLTCFNRRESTLACLRALQASVGLENVQLSAVLVDDGSRDGTASAVREAFDWVQVIEHQGEPLFWCRGMHQALAQAQLGNHDHYLLLNDDTLLRPDAVARLLACHAELVAAHGQPALVVGSTQDAGDGHLTYGGQRRTARHRPVNFGRVVPSEVPQRLDTFNGNVVLLPADVVARVGNLDAAYEHAMGDTDYGLRALQAGVGVWLAPGFHGTCSNNAVAGTFTDSALPLRRRWHDMMSRKGLPWRSWLHFTRAHAGVGWPAFFVWPYAKLLISGLLLRR